MEFSGNIFGYASSVVRALAPPYERVFKAWVLFQWIDYFCSFIDSNLGWRIPLSIQVVIGVILALGSIILPESPR
jgi:hypothetical protein